MYLSVRTFLENGESDLHQILLKHAETTELDSEAVVVLRTLPDFSQDDTISCRLHQPLLVCEFLWNSALDFHQN